MAERILNYIDGNLVPPVGGRYLENHEPATGAVYAETPDSDADDIGRAVESAHRAFRGWSRMPATERSAWMMRIADRIAAESERFVRAESRDTGKPQRLARAVDIPRAESNLRFFAGAVLHTESQAHQTDRTALNVTLREPRGVAGCISPWNLPLYLFTWKIAPALATGNTVVGKPSEVTPMTAYLLAEVCREEGLPPGVLNIVHGRGPSAGAALVEHPEVPTLSFTGGTTTGSTIGVEAARRFKKVSLELGGKNPTVIFADVDLDRVLPEIVRSAFSNQGQICLSGSRILVEAPLYERFLARFTEAAAALRVGDPDAEETDVGALVSSDHRDKVLSYVAVAREEGGTVHTGGAPPEELPERCRNGYFVSPTVITGVPSSGRVMQEEIFGPVATVTPFTTESEALQIANGTAYGLAASIWTRDLERAHRVAAEIQSGIVWVNCWMLRDLRTPFGGMKQSGVGREGGEEALRFFTEPKNVCFRLEPDAPEGNMSEDRSFDSGRAPEPVGAYPHARRVGNLLFLSGIGPRVRGLKEIPGVTLDAAGTVVDHDIEAQCRSMFANVRAVLEDAGSSWEQIVDVTVFLTDMKRDFATMNRIYAEHFTENRPTRTTVEIGALPTPIAVEVKVIATVG